MQVGLAGDLNPARSTTTSLAPCLRASLMVGTRCNCDTVTLLPQRMIRRACAVFRAHQRHGSVGAEEGLFLHPPHNGRRDRRVAPSL